MRCSRSAAANGEDRARERGEREKKRRASHEKRRTRGGRARCSSMHAAPDIYTHEALLQRPSFARAQANIVNRGHKFCPRCARGGKKRRIKATRDTVRFACITFTRTSLLLAHFSTKVTLNSMYWFVTSEFVVNTRLKLGSALFWLFSGS